MANDLDPDLQAKIEYRKSQDQELVETSMSASSPEVLKDRKAPEIAATQSINDGNSQKLSIEALIGMMGPGATLFQYEETNREFDKLYHDRVAGGSHREFEGQFTAVVNQTGVDRIDLVFDHLPTFGRFSTERGATHEIKSAIISAGLEVALEEAGVPEHHHSTFKHELNVMRAPYRNEAIRGVMFGTREGEVSVAPGLTRQAWHYDVNGKK